jgi:hypothetical protein
MDILTFISLKIVMVLAEERSAPHRLGIQRWSYGEMEAF